jgi:hypothetical protein
MSVMGRWSVLAVIQWHVGLGTHVPRTVTAWTRTPVRITWEMAGIGLRSGWGQRQRARSDAAADRRHRLRHPHRVPRAPGVSCRGGWRGRCPSAGGRGPHRRAPAAGPTHPPPQARLDRGPPHDRVRRPGHLPLHRRGHRVVDQEVRPHRPPLPHHRDPARQPTPSPPNNPYPTTSAQPSTRSSAAPVDTKFRPRTDHSAARSTGDRTPIFSPERAAHQGGCD